MRRQGPTLWLLPAGPPLSRVPLTGKSEASAVSLVLSETAAKFVAAQVTLHAALSASADIALSQVCGGWGCCRPDWAQWAAAPRSGAAHRAVGSKLLLQRRSHNAAHPANPSRCAQKWRTNDYSLDALIAEDVLSAGLADGALVDLSAGGEHCFSTRAVLSRYR